MQLNFGYGQFNTQNTLIVEPNYICKKKERKVKNRMSQNQKVVSPRGGCN